MNWSTGMWIVILTALLVLTVTVNMCDDKTSQLRPVMQRHGPHQ